MVSAKLQRVYDEYCTAQGGMDGKSFSKLAKDCGLLDEKLMAGDVDLIYFKIKHSDERKINLDQFLDGLVLLAKKKGVHVDTVEKRVEQSMGPILRGTKAQPTKFHDDKSLYTGVYANGGPKTVDKDKIADHSLMDRSKADVRGVKVGGYSGRSNDEERLQQEEAAGSSKRKDIMPCADTAKLREVFDLYCVPSDVMDGKYFAKLSRDCELIDDRTLKATDVDLTFARIKGPRETRITYEQFLLGLALLAEKKSVSRRNIEMAVSKSEGPLLYGTVAQPNKYHDDKSLYTGVYAHGGPTTVDEDKIRFDSNSLTDIRNMRIPTYGDRKAREEMEEREERKGRKKDEKEEMRVTADDSPELQRVFGLYCPAQTTMDSQHFFRCIRDAKLLDTGITATDVDLAFTKAKTPSQRRLTYPQFLFALGALATKRGSAVDDVSKRVECAPGPSHARQGAQYGRLQEVFAAYSERNSGGMSKTQFGALCKAHKLIGLRHSVSDIEGIFSEAAARPRGDEESTLSEGEEGNEGDGGGGRNVNRRSNDSKERKDRERGARGEREKEEGRHSEKRLSFQQFLGEHYWPARPRRAAATFQLALSPGPAPESLSVQTRWKKRRNAEMKLGPCVRNQRREVEALAAVVQSARERTVSDSSLCSGKLVDDGRTSEAEGSGVWRRRREGRRSGEEEAEGAASSSSSPGGGGGGGSSVRGRDVEEEGPMAARPRPQGWATSQAFAQSAPAAAIAAALKPKPATCDASRTAPGLTSKAPISSRTAGKAPAAVASSKPEASLSNTPISKASLPTASDNLKVPPAKPRDSEGGNVSGKARGSPKSSLELWKLQRQPPSRA